MKRGNKNKTIITNKKADLIITADIHLQEKQPVCRKDDFYEKQWSKLDFISVLQQVHDCPVIHAGDLYEHWKPSPHLLSKTIEHLPNNFHTIYGNHDLPQHNLELSHKSGIYTLWVADKLSILGGCHWGEIPIKPTLIINGKKILVWHAMTYQGIKPWHDCTAPKASKLLRKYPQFDLIITGHNHKPFTEEHEDRLIVNAGSIFRLEADQINHKPRVYLWYADTNTVKPVYIPIEGGVISREHIERRKVRNDRLDAFISGLNTDWQAGLSFIANLEKHMGKNVIKKEIQDIIYDAID